MGLRPTYFIATIPTLAISATAIVPVRIDFVSLNERLLRGAACRLLVVPSRSMIYLPSPTGCYESLPHMRGEAYQMQYRHILVFRLLTARPGGKTADGIRGPPCTDGGLESRGVRGDRDERRYAGFLSSPEGRGGGIRPP